MSAQRLTQGVPMTPNPQTTPQPQKRHRLFWKILLLFWLTLTATVVINILITQQILEIEIEKRFSDSRIQSLAEDAVTIYESGGTKAFARWARKQRRESGVHISLKNQQGQTLVGRYQVPENPGLTLPPPISRDIISDEQKTYRVELHFSYETPKNLRHSHPFHWLRWVATFAIVAFASWLLSRHLARPIDALSQASREFAQGNLQVRLSPQIRCRNDELGQLANDFDNMAEEIERLISQQRQLLRDISHEIRTPLTRQRLLLELARRKGADTHFIEQIEHQNEKVDQLLSELLSLERMNNPHSERTTIDLCQLVATVAQQCQIEADAKSIQIAVLYSLPDLTAADKQPSLTITGNTALLERAIENVLRNAIRYAPINSVVTVTIARDLSGPASISIEDAGPGVTEANLDKIFTPFFRDDLSRNETEGGIGLGLSIARKAAQLHNGSIYAANRREGGLEVVFRLPC